MEISNQLSVFIIILIGMKVWRIMLSSAFIDWKNWTDKMLSELSLNQNKARILAEKCRWQQNSDQIIFLKKDSPLTKVARKAKIQICFSIFIFAAKYWSFRYCCSLALIVSSTLLQLNCAFKWQIEIFQQKSWGMLFNILPSGVRNCVEIKLVHPKYSKQWPYLLATTMDCSKINGFRLCHFIPFQVFWFTF